MVHGHLSGRLGAGAVDYTVPVAPTSGVVLRLTAAQGDLIASSAAGLTLGLVVVLLKAVAFTH